MAEIDLLRLISVKDELPGPYDSTVAFVPLLGFTSAIFNGNNWKSTITHKIIKPTHWLKPTDEYEALADKLGLKEDDKQNNTWKDKEGKVFIATRLGFKEWI